MPWAATIVAVVAMVVSMVVSIIQQRAAARKAKKAQEEAEKAEDRRKGIEVVTEGESRPVAVVYGRAKIGGARVFHAIQNSFIFVDSNADHTFGTGLNAGTTATSIGHSKMTPEGVITWESTQIQAQESTSISLGKTIRGHKNEYLYWQQALCYGPINHVVDVIVEDSNTLDNPVYGSIGISHKTKKKSGKVKYWYNGTPGNAIRVDIHLNGGEEDKVCSTNNSNRRSATFGPLEKDSLGQNGTGIAYASCVCKQDRDDPAFSAVPKLQFLVEGLKIRPITSNYHFGNTLEYTTNPATILADYLTNKIYGAGLSEDILDMESFYKAQVICEEIVMYGAAVGGLFWQNSDGSRDIAYRDVPRFECCIAIDGTSSIRDNVNQILKTMQGAKLIWSQGKFKLVLNYPKSITDLSSKSVYEITDDDIVAGENIDITGTTGDNRYNWCKVTYADESQNFENNSCSWPPKKTEQYMEPIGGKSYPSVTGWGTDKEGLQFLNSYAVATNNEGFGHEETITWDFIAETGGNHTFSANGDDVFSLTVQKCVPNEYGYKDYQDLSPRIANSGRQDGAPKRITLNLSENTQYRVILTMKFTQSGASWYEQPPVYGAGFCVTDPNGVQVCSSRDAAYSDYINKAVYDDIYKAYLNADSDVELETEVTADGITDYYHALALAEQTVRQSRAAAMLSLKVVLRSVYYEPGDIVSVNSSYLNLGTGFDVNGVPLSTDYYECISAFTKTSPSVINPREDAAHWKVLSKNTKGTNTVLNWVNNTVYKKGDIVYYSTGEVSKPYFEVDSVQYEENDTCSLTLKRIDPYMFAWNVDDDQLAPVQAMFSQEHVAPTWVRFNKGLSIYQGSAGIVEWANVPGNNVVNYSVFVNIGGELDNTGALKWTMLGQADSSPYSVGSLDISRAIFGVCANYKDNVQSDITMSDVAFANEALNVLGWNPVTKVLANGDIIKANNYLVYWKNYVNLPAFNMIKTAIKGWRDGETNIRAYFRCKETIGYEPTPDKDTAHWVKSNKSSTTAWNRNTAYLNNALVTFNNAVYQCINNEDVAYKPTPDRDTLNWQLLNSSVVKNLPTWSINVQYANGTKVVYNNKVYQCIETIGFKSTKNPMADTANWTLLENKQLDATAWKSGNSYKAGDLVYYQLTADEQWTGKQGCKGSNYWGGGTAASAWVYTSPWVTDNSYVLTWQSGKNYAVNSVVEYNSKFYKCILKTDSTNNTKTPDKLTTNWTAIGYDYIIFAVRANFWNYYHCKLQVAASTTGSNVSPSADTTHWTPISNFWDNTLEYSPDDIVLYINDGILECYRCTTAVAPTIETPADDYAHWSKQSTSFNAKNPYDVGAVTYVGSYGSPQYIPIDKAEVLLAETSALDMTWAASAKIVANQGYLFKLDNNNAATPASLTFKAEVEYFKNPKYEWYFIGRESTKLSKTNSLTLTYANIKSYFGSTQRLQLYVYDGVSGNNVRYDSVSVFALNNTNTFYVMAARQKIDIYCDAYGNSLDGTVEWFSEIYAFIGTAQIPRSGKNDTLEYVLKTTNCSAQISQRVSDAYLRIYSMREKTAAVTIEVTWKEGKTQKGKTSTTIVLQRLNEAFPAREVGWYEFSTEKQYNEITAKGVWVENLGNDFKPMKNDRMIVHTGVVYSTTAEDANGDSTVASTNDNSREVTYVYDGETWIEQKYYFDGNMLVKGTVTADALNVLNLSAISANMGTITAGNIVGKDCEFSGKLKAATGEFAGSLRAGVIDFKSLAGKALTLTGDWGLNEIPDHCTKITVTAIGAGGGGWAAIPNIGMGHGGSSGGAVINAVKELKNVFVMSTVDFDNGEDLISKLTPTKIIGYMAAEFPEITVNAGMYLVVKLSVDSSKYVVCKSYTKSNANAWRIEWTYKNVASYKTINPYIQVKVGTKGLAYQVDNLSETQASVSGAAAGDSSIIIAAELGAQVIARGGINATGTTIAQYNNGTRTASARGTRPANNSIKGFVCEENNDIRGQQSLTVKPTKTPSGAKGGQHPLTGAPYKDGDGSVNGSYYVNDQGGGEYKSTTIYSCPGDAPGYQWQSYGQVGGAGGPSYVGTISHSVIINSTRYFENYQPNAYRSPNVWAHKSSTTNNLVSMPTAAYNGGGGAGGAIWTDIAPKFYFNGHGIGSTTSLRIGYQSGVDGSDGYIVAQFYDENSVVLRLEYENLVSSLRTYLGKGTDPWHYESKY